jgi:sugar/nucleoside kinase (ribokinase family)
MRLDLTIPSADSRPFDVVGLGINVIDYLFRIPRFPEPDTKSDALAVSVQGGGLTATAMVACARLGLRTRYIGKFGSDQIGRVAREELAAEGLELGAAVQATDAPNRLCFVMVEEGSGHRTIIRHRDTRIWLRPAELARATLCAGRVLHLDGYEGDAALQAARWARAADIPVSLDAEEPTEGREALLAVTDILIVGLRFGSALTGRTEPGAVLDGLARLGPRCVGLTLGEHGSLLAHGGRVVEAAGYAVPVVDTTGAGDVFHGAFLYGVLRGWDAGDILRFANAVAALKCTQLGGRTGIPRVAEVRAFLQERGEQFPEDPGRKE